MNIELPTPNTSGGSIKKVYKEQLESPTLNLKSIRTLTTIDEDASLYTPDATMKLSSSQKSDDDESINNLTEPFSNCLDKEVLATIEKLRELESKVSGVEDIKESLLNLKATILRLNLKNTLLKNELSKTRSTYSHERNKLLEEMKNYEQMINASNSEREAVNSRNLKLVKYIKTLKNERIKKCVNENRQLKARLDHMENINGSICESPTTSTSPTSQSMTKLNTLGRIAAVYLRESKPPNN